jgi:carbonic anhydrase
MFNSRVAGNIVNEDILGSLEFACAVAGSKVVLVMGHTACGAIDKVQLGNLTVYWKRFARRLRRPSTTASAPRRVISL